VEKQGKAGQTTDDNIIRRMRFACWTANVYINNTYKILTAFSQQQWLRERAEILRFKYTSSLVINFIFVWLSRVFRREKKV
jgi:hypothetical protein